MKDTGYVLKTKKGLYYCRMNIFDKNIIRAKMYPDKSQAKAAKRSIESARDLRIFIIRVNITEVEE